MNFFIKTLLLQSNVSARGGVISAVEMPGEYGSIGVSNLTNLSREIRVGGVISSLSEIEVTKIIFLAVIYMQFLFHMRVLDEVKILDTTQKIIQIGLSNGVLFHWVSSIFCLKSMCS